MLRIKSPAPGYTTPVQTPGMTAGGTSKKPSVTDLVFTQLENYWKDIRQTQFRGLQDKILEYASAVGR